MLFSELSRVPLAERKAYPFAVAVSDDTEDAQVLRFDSAAAADLTATLLDNHDGKVRRLVALTEPEWQGVPVIHGWRVVSYFNV